MNGEQKTDRGIAALINPVPREKKQSDAVRRADAALQIVTILDGLSTPEVVNVMKMVMLAREDVSENKDWSQAADVLLEKSRDRAVGEMQQPPQKRGWFR